MTPSPLPVRDCIKILVACKAGKAAGRTTIAMEYLKRSNGTKSDYGVVVDILKKLDGKKGFEVRG